MKKMCSRLLKLLGHLHQAAYDFLHSAVVVANLACALFASWEASRVPMQGAGFLQIFAELRNMLLQRSCHGHGQGQFSKCVAQHQGSSGDAKMHLHPHNPCMLPSVVTCSEVC